MVHKVADRVNEQDRERVIGDGVDCLSGTTSHMSKAKPPFGKIVSVLKQRELALVEADKEGGFVVMSEGMFQEKALVAIKKNFKAVMLLPKQQKSAALKMLKDLNLDGLSKAANKAESGFLELFFTGKTHKPDCPLRAIVSERSTWQAQVSRYLQRHLNTLAVDDPFLVRSSDEVV